MRSTKAVKRIEAYGWILAEVFLRRVKARSEWDDVEFCRDMEDSLRALPIIRGDRGATRSLATVLIMCGHGWTHKMVGDHYQLTRERVRQIVSKALRMMRHPSRSNHLWKWLEGEIDEHD